MRPAFALCFPLVILHGRKQNTKTGKITGHSNGDILDQEIDCRDFLIRHRALIAERLKLHHESPSVLLKYEWMRQYHNQVVGEIGDPFFPYCGIKREDLLLPDGQMGSSGM